MRQLSKAVSEWVKAEGVRLTTTVLDELKGEVERVKADLRGKGRSVLRSV